jgi:hypothetical protein
MAFVFEIGRLVSTSFVKAPLGNPRSVFWMLDTYKKITIVEACYFLYRTKRGLEV